MGESSEDRSIFDVYREKQKKKVLDLRELSGVDEVDAADVKGTKIAILDNYSLSAKSIPGGEIINSASVYNNLVDTDSHGVQVTKVAELVYPESSLIKVQGINDAKGLPWKDWRRNMNQFIEALRTIDNLSEKDGPNIVSISAMPLLSAKQTLIPVLQARAKEGKVGSITAKHMQKIWGRLEEKLMTKFKDRLNQLRQKGIVFVAAVPNQPNDRDYMMHWDKEELVWLLVTPQPGVIGVGGITATSQESIFGQQFVEGYTRLGYSQLAQVTGVSLWEADTKKGFIEGNSAATPMIAVGVGMIISKLPGLKKLKPHIRESIILRILGESTNTVEAKHYLKQEDKSFRTETKEVEVVSLSKLKDILTEKGDHYTQEIQDELNK